MLDDLEHALRAELVREGVAGLDQIASRRQQYQPAGRLTVGHGNQGTVDLHRRRGPLQILNAGRWLGGGIVGGLE